MSQNTSVRKARGLEQRLVEALQREEEDFIERLKVIGGEQTSFGGGSVGGDAPSSSSPGEGIYVKKAGDVMLGPLAFDPEVLAISGGVLDISKELGRFKPRIIMSAESGSADDLDFIKGAANAGQILHLQTVAGQTITVKHDTSGNGSGGFNIRTPDALDFVMTDVQTLAVIFNSVTNQWLFWDSSIFLAGANKQLSNLSSTAINTDLLPDTNIVHNLGSALFSWTSLWVAAIRFDDDLAAPTGASPDRISTGLPASIPTMEFNVKAAISRYDFFHLGVPGMSISKDAASNIIIDPDTVSIGINAQFQPTTSVPAINGVMSHDSGSGDVRVFSGGALRNFSDIVAAANKTLSNLDSPTAINKDLLPEANITKDLGSALLSWASLWIAAIRFDDNLAAPTSASPHRISTGELAGDSRMHFNIKDSVSSFEFYYLGVIGMSIRKNAAGQILINPDIVTIGDSAQFQPKTSAPAINGVMALDSGATNVRVFSGGELRDFSQIAERNETETISGLWTFTNSIFNVNSANIFMGDATSDDINFTARVNTDFDPVSDNTVDLGGSTLRWKNIFSGRTVDIKEGFAAGFAPTGNTDRAELFSRPDGAGKTELRVKFQTGTSVLIAIEP